MCGSTCDSVLTWDSPQNVRSSTQKYGPVAPLRGRGVTLCCLSAGHVGVFRPPSIQKCSCWVSSLTHQSVGRAGSTGLFQDQVGKGKVHCNFCLSVWFSSSLSVAGIYFPHLSIQSACQKQFVGFTSSVLVRRKNLVGPLAYLVRKSFSVSPQHPQGTGVSERRSRSGQPAARGVSLGLTHRMRGRPAFRDLCPLLR